MGLSLPSYFEKFLREIRPTENQKEDCKNGHQKLRKLLNEYEGLKGIVVSTFLQGSYRRATAIRPRNDNKLDVDIIIVTRIDKDKFMDPNRAMDLFIPFLNDNYKGKYKRQGRSIGIELSQVDLDFVITSAPSEAEELILLSKSVTSSVTPEDSDDWRLVESWVPKSDRESEEGYQFYLNSKNELEWKTQPLYIPDRDAKEWKPTHPLEQIKWTWGKNARCNKHYVNVVKAIKWWQKINYGDDRPRGYPLEHLIGICCPDNIDSVAEGIVLTFEAMVSNYSNEVNMSHVPNIIDHGVNQNVFEKISSDEFAEFYDHVIEAATIARNAYNAQNKITAATKWRELLGDKFPTPPTDNKDDDDNDSGNEKGPFLSPKLPAGDLSPRQYG